MLNLGIMPILQSSWYGKLLRFMDIHVLFSCYYVSQQGPIWENIYCDLAVQENPSVTMYEVDQKEIAYLD